MRNLTPPTLAATVLALAWQSPASAATVEIAPGADLGASIAELTPGDELVLAGGTYTLTSRLAINVSGTAASPIVIRAKDGEVPVITRDANQNVINIEGASHVTLLDLEINGGSHGIRMTDANFITIEQCHVHDTADVGISANVPGSSYEGLQLLRNHIHDTGGTGEGMYLGCNDAGCVMSESTIAGNYIHDTLGTSQGDGIEIKHGSWGNVVADNVIHDTNYPCIIVYGTDGQPPNVIERNALWGCGDHGIQAASDATIRNNIILDVNSNGIHSQIHQGATPGNLQIVHNTIVVDGDAVRVNDIAASVVVANNALVSQSGYALRAGGNTALLTTSGNGGLGAVQGGPPGTLGLSLDLTRDFNDVAARDVFPPTGSALIGSGDPAHVTAVDYNGTSRLGVADIGAYASAAGDNPGSPLTSGPKMGLVGGLGGAPGAGGAGAAAGSGAGANGGASSVPSGVGGASNAGAAGSAGTGASDAGTGDPSGVADSGDDGGCGCRTAGAPPHSVRIGWVALFAIALLRRRQG